MEKIVNPEKQQWASLAARPEISSMDLQSIVNKVFDNVKRNGDNALSDYTMAFDNVQPGKLSVNKEMLEKSEVMISEKMREAIKTAKINIEKFHMFQKETIRIVETSNGVNCWRESRPIERVGIYIPGGTAPLFSTVLMLAIPARLAGCEEIVLCTPPGPDGTVNPAILYAARVTGVTSVFIVGGIQAIAAMTYGTETIPQVFKIFGPGNQYVTAAKQKAFECGVAIDMPAGPSELLVIADRTAKPEYVAADLLSQAEHGIDSQVILLSDDSDLIDKILLSVKKQLPLLQRNITAAKSLFNSRAILLPTLEDCVRFSNLYAPEHLIIATDAPGKLAEGVCNAGSVFLGHYSCESAGDYASGTNHTLPTNGYARNYSGISVDSFVKKITFQQLTRVGLKNIGPAVVNMAEAEGLQAHANAVSIRLN